MNRRHVFGCAGDVVVGIAAAAALSGWMGSPRCDAADAPPAPANWLVYNATLNGIAGVIDRDNGFNANCKGWSWQEAGFLDAHGRPYAINAATGNIMNGNAVVGTRVSPGVYASNVADIGVADLSGGATLQGVYDRMLPLAAAGRLHISSHGSVRKIGNDIVPGGLLLLDNNTVFAGFREPGTTNTGTNIQGFNPYAITARDPAVAGRFALELYNCNGGRDPDGTGPERSVRFTGGTAFGKVQTAPTTTVQRVTTVASSAPTVRCTVTVTPELPANVPANFFEVTVKNYMKKNKPLFNECTTPSSWLAGLSMDDHYSSMVARLGTVAVPANSATGYPGGNLAVTWNLHYNQTSTLSTFTRGDDPGEPALDEPAIWSLSGGAEATASYNAEDGGLGASCTVRSLVSGAVDGTALHLCAAADVEISAPSADLELATSVMRLSPYADSFTSVAGTMSLQYADDIDPSGIQLYEMIGSAWVPFASPTTIDPSAQMASADFEAAGAFDESNGLIVAGFAPVPEPATALTLGLLTTRLLTLRQRRRSNHGD